MITPLPYEFNAEGLIETHRGWKTRTGYRRDMWPRRTREGGWLPPRYIYRDPKGRFTSKRAFGISAGKTRARARRVRRRMADIDDVLGWDREKGKGWLGVRDRKADPHYGEWAP